MYALFACYQISKIDLHKRGYIALRKIMAGYRWLKEKKLIFYKFLIIEISNEK